MLSHVKSLLSSVPMYVGLQKAVGAHRVRYLALERLNLQDGDVILDVGCGPAYYFDRLPNVKYYGFDTSERYIEHARKNFGDRGSFRCEIFTEEHLPELPPVDKVILMGLLHHLTDDQCRHLLDLSARVLAPTGEVCSIDPTFEPNQNPIAKWMSSNDRGEHVRQPEGFVALAKESFGDIEGEIVNDVTRVPTTTWLMRMRKPLVAAES
ncbi:hypothetical protein GCM10009682_18530 [Luedemannella flava]|uniref:Methyltransferase domain-containing protein n=1 Tax=Luedemannella flava TaxID=349316 RepID=A0ABP4XY64_9ACTN